MLDMYHEAKLAKLFETWHYQGQSHWKFEKKPVDVVVEDEPSRTFQSK